MEVPMNSLADTTIWYKALNRKERATRIVEHQQKIRGGSELLRQYLSNEELQAIDLFVQQDEGGITPEEFDAVKAGIRRIPLEILAEQQLGEPEWVAEIQTALTEKDYQKIPPRYYNNSRQWGLAHVAGQILNKRIQEFEGALIEIEKKYSTVNINKGSLLSGAIDSLIGRTMAIVGRTMVLELQVANYNGLLSEETEQERFLEFVRLLRDTDTSVGILKEYPVMARGVHTASQQWKDTYLEILARYCEDVSRPTSECVMSQTSSLSQIQTNLGDSHNGGRSVAMLLFEDRTRTVYKPRSLSVDAEYQRILQWVNSSIGKNVFKLTNIWERSEYGWCEFIEHWPCTGEEEVETFYQELGSHLAILYLLNATDFHSENLIAHGRHPVLIDLESLFHSTRVDNGNLGAISTANSVLTKSVLMVGLLPRRMWGDPEQEDGFDLSGMGGRAGQKTPFKAPRWTGVGTTHMRLERQFIESTGHQNLPSVNGQEVDPAKYINHVINGFRSVYDLIINRQEKFLTLIHSFKYCQIRHIVRPTRYYGMNLMEGYHPDLMMDAMDRDDYFDQIRESMRGRPELSDLIPSERKSLWEHDVPYFYTYAGDSKIYCQGETVTNSLGMKSGIEEALDKIRGLTTEDYFRQEWLIRASIATLSMGPDAPGAMKGRSAHTVQEQTPDVLLPEDLLGEAKQLGQRIVEQAIVNDELNHATWLGLQLINNKNWHVNPVGLNLYDGVGGICLFLAYLGKFTEDKHVIGTAQKAAQYIRYQWQQLKQSINAEALNGFKLPLGAFTNSPTGAVYLYTHLAKIWEDDDFLIEAVELAKATSIFIDVDEQFDIISGAASFIIVLIRLYDATRNAELIEIALKAGDHLVKNAEKQFRGVGWSTSSFPRHPLTGFSHGAAGISWALSILGRATNQDIYTNTALEAIEYENSLYNPDLGCWPDLRTEPDKNPPERSMQAWCHGAPGIGLSRLASIEAIGNRYSLARDAERAIVSTKSAESLGNHSLCHGELGNLELFLKGADILSDVRAKEIFDKKLYTVFQDIRTNGALCGVPSGVDTPGFMTGISGIGYQLLRFARPHSLPSVLLLE